jgi:hypothetical protein
MLPVLVQLFAVLAIFRHFGHLLVGELWLLGEASSIIFMSLGQWNANAVALATSNALNKPSRFMNPPFSDLMAGDKASKS